MVVSDSQHQIAVSFVQIGTHDCARRGDVEATVVQQPRSHVLRCDSRYISELGDPACIDLHDAEVLRTIGVDMNDTDITPLNTLDRWQHARRQVVERRYGRHTGKQRNTHDRGFTLLELLVVIVILGLLIGLVGPAVMRQLGSARASVARESIERLESVLDLYKLDVGDYPSTEQGLQALVEQPSDVASWSGPYLKGDKLPLDPWNHPYEYRNPSTRSGHAYDLCSMGPTGASTSQDMICNP